MQHNYSWIPKIFILLLSLFFSTNVYSQFCGTKILPEQAENLNRLHSRQRSAVTQINHDEITFIPIKAHIVRRNDGTGGLTEIQLEAAIENLNTRFEYANMKFFLYEGVNLINNSRHYDFSWWNEDELAAPNDVANVINIYFVNTIEHGTICGYAYLPGYYDRILMAYECTIDGNVLAHEVGHYFNLYHTHGKSSGFGFTDELVDGSNCETAGDDVCDTPADPGLGSFNVNSQCTYTGSATDSNGHRFVPQVRNIMSYSPIHCADLFTEGQYIRMTHALVEYRNYLNTYTEPIIITDPPVVNFIADITNPITSQIVHFTDQSSNRPDTWEWTFSPAEGVLFVDGTTKNSKNPKVKFSNVGLISVTLTASNEIGESTFTKTSYINVLEPVQPVADFSASKTIARAGELITLTDISANTPTEWSWNITPSTFTFENGTNAHSKNIQVKFTENGSYDVKLVVANDAGEHQVVREGYILIQELAGDNCSSAIDLSRISSPYTASLNDKSNSVDVCGGDKEMIFFMDVPDGYIFEIGQTQNVWYYSQSLRYGSTCPGQNEIVCYWDSSSRRIKWENTTGSLQRVYYVHSHNYFSETNDFTLTWSLKEGLPPVAKFSATKTVAMPYDYIQLKDESENEPSAWEWDITPWQNVRFNSNDGKYQKNPYVYFTAIGNYTVRLKVANAKGEDQIIKENYIQVRGANASPVVRTEPEYWLPQDEVTFFFDVSGTHLMNIAEDIYFFSENPAYRQEKVGTWENSSENAKLTHIEGNSYSFTMTPSAFYEIDDALSYWWNFSFVLKNKDGTSSTLHHWYDYTVAPVADFTQSSNIIAGWPAYFSSSSSYNPEGHEWVFTPSEDVEIWYGSKHSSYLEVKFKKAGEYKVKLKVWNRAGADEKEKTITVGQPPLPEPEFFSYPTQPTVYDEVFFYNYTYNYPESFHWEFSPSTVTYLSETSATSSNPIVRFNEATSYTVKLTATNSTGSKEITKENYINVERSYCRPVISNPYESYITGFGVGDFDHYPWWVGENGYGDYTWYPIQLMNTYSGHMWIYMNSNSQNNGKLSVWVDFNNDKEFGENEKLIDNQEVIRHSLSVMPFSLPEGTAAGTYRLRVRLSESTVNLSDACSDLSVGGTLDYTLHLIETVPPVAHFEVSMLEPKVDEIVYLSAGSGSAYNFPETYEWSFYPAEGIEYLYDSNPHSQYIFVKFNEVGMYSVALNVANSAGSNYKVQDDLIRVGISSEGTCEEALDLATLGGHYIGSTVNNSNNYQGCYMGNAKDRFFYIDLPTGAAIDIGQIWNNYDSSHELRYGGSCPGNYSIACIDDWDYERVQWTNNTGQTQRVYYIQSGYSNRSGDFELTWSVTNVSLPVADFSMSESFTGEGSAISFQDLSTGSVSSRKWIITPLQGFEFVQNTDKFSEAPIIKFNKTGTYNVTLYAYNAGGYNAKTISLEVLEQQEPVIVWENPADITYGSLLSEVQLNASTDVEGSFTYNYETGTKLNVGEHSLVAVFTPADAIQYKKVTKAVVIKVAKAEQTITLAEIENKKDGDGSFKLDAGVSSGLPLEVVVGGPAILEEGMLKIQGPGIVTILIRQGGNENYLPASDLLYSFCVSPSPVISIVNSSEENVDLKLVSNYVKGNQWIFNNEIIEGANQQELVVTKSGMYKVRNQVSGCMGESDPMLVTSAEGGRTEAGISLYPNPAKDKLHLISSETIPANEILMEVYNMVGVKVLEQIVPVNNHSLEAEINTQSLKPGTYLLVFNNGKKVRKLKFQKSL